MTATPGQKPRRPRLVTVALAVALALAAAALALQMLNTRRAWRPNVVLITIDTLRADALGCYGGKTARTPALDTLAADGARFDNAWSVAFGTTPSHTSIMTSLYSRQHGVTTNSLPMASSQITLARILRGHGYTTGAFVSALPVDRDRNFDMGFDVFNQWFDPAMNKVERRAGDAANAAVSWLETAGDKPFFLWVHAYDPHVRYDPPQPFRKQSLSRTVSDADLDAAYAQARTGRVAPDQAVHLKALYAGEVSYTDAQIGALIQWLKNQNLYENTLIVVVADHGETLDETRPGPAFDHTTVYNEVARVPLILRLPGRFPRGLTVAAPVCTLDILPTILDLARIPIPGKLPARGVSLVRHARGRISDNDRRRTIYIESTGAYAAGVIRGHYKYLRIRNPASYFQDPAARVREQLFDLQHDPGERTNLAAHRPERAGLRRLVDDWQKANPRATPRITMNDARRREMREKLKSLGYVE